MGSRDGMGRCVWDYQGCKKEMGYGKGGGHGHYVGFKDLLPAEKLTHYRTLTHPPARLHNRRAASLVSSQEEMFIAAVGREAESNTRYSHHGSPRTMSPRSTPL